jgi:hypothetical protein
MVILKKMILISNFFMDDEIGVDLFHSVFVGCKLINRSIGQRHW